MKTALLALVLWAGLEGAATAQSAPQPSTVEQARSHFERGRSAYREGQFRQALEHLTRADQLSPSPELEFDLARVYERLGEAEAAIRHFERYLAEAQPEAAERTGIEARVRALRAQIERQRPQALDPPDSAALTAEARAFFERGIKLFQQKQYTAALAAFAAARRFAPLPELSYNLALCCEQLRRNGEAVDYYRAYLREAKSAPDAARVQARIRALRTEQD